MVLTVRVVWTALVLAGLAACATPPQPSRQPTGLSEMQSAPAAVAVPPSMPGPAGPVVSSTVTSPVTEPAQPSPVESAPAVASSAQPAAAPLARGLASWYGGKFHGRRTASGDRYDMHGLTAAHRTLPFGTRVRVRSVLTGKEVVVRINDRGPYKRQRIIDLSLGAITALGVRHRGVTEVVLLRE